MPHTAIDLPAVGFELRFTGTACPDAAAQLRHLHAAPSQSGQHVFELRQLDLQLSFARFRVPSKNIEDELRAINHALMQDAFDVALLRGRQVVVEENQIGFRRSGCFGNLLELAAPDQRGRIRTVAPLQQFADDDRACASGQRVQFIERLFRAELRDAGRFRSRCDAGRGIARCLRSCRNRFLRGVARAHAVIEPH
jgi:hypothetical protein